jgi:hypothetical protein
MSWTVKLFRLDALSLSWQEAGRGTMALTEQNVATLSLQGPLLDVEVEGTYMPDLPFHNYFFHKNKAGPLERQFHFKGRELQEKGQESYCGIFWSTPAEGVGDPGDVGVWVATKDTPPPPAES